MIGPFKFDYDDDIESDILVPGQVYDDLKELDKILKKTAHGNTGGTLKKKWKCGKFMKWFFG